MTKQAVIFLHGVGSRGDDLQPLARYWSSLLPDTTFILPNAPFQFDQGGGYQWFSVSGITEQTRPARIAAARADLDAVIHGLLVQYDIDPAHDQIILAGFSQGAIMALDVLVSGRFPLAGVVAFSGRLASPAPFTPNQGTRALLVHGKNDSVIPWTESETAARRLTDIGLAVETYFEDGAVHTITAEGAGKAARFMAQRFALAFPGVTGRE